LRPRAARLETKRNFFLDQSCEAFKRGIFGDFFYYFIQHCFICRPSESTVSQDAGIEPRTVATTALAVRRLEHGPGVIKRYKKHIEEFQKSIQKAQRGHGGKHLGWHRDRNQPGAGPHLDPDTSSETLHGSSDVNLQGYPRKKVLVHAHLSRCWSSG
jgi:hypothetical protein